MESYPGELLVGVFPLVFCVDATLPSKAASGDVDTAAGTSPNNHGCRSQFDRFLDTLASSLLNEPGGSDAIAFSPAGRRRSVDDGKQSFFRGQEEGLDSDQEDDFILGGDSNGLPIRQAEGSNDRDLKQSLSFSNIHFPRIGIPATKVASKEGSVSRTDTSFAKVLQEGQGFFQRARIVSVSTRHGFPPSKDPTGEDSRIKDFFLGKSMQTAALQAAIKRRPIDGILPSGWLEKHAAALPSVIIIVAQINSHQRQHEQNTRLDETMKNISISLARKRGCSIRIVGLIQDGISAQMASDWKARMGETLEGNPPITLLDLPDLNQDAPPSMTMYNLQKQIHESSLGYYINQARRTKRKLYELGPARGTPLLIPLCIRYFFKVAMFYEFQWRPEKSLKYMMEAYRHIAIYFQYLIQRRRAAKGIEAEGETSETPKLRLSTPEPDAQIYGGGTEGVEVSIPADDTLNKLLLNPPSEPDDMVHQCRKIADWLNFKILQSCLATHTEGGLLAASAQLQKHAYTFCNPRRSFVCSPHHAYMDWALIAHQRMVASQLLERNPPRVPESQFDEVILRCLPGRSYEGVAEAYLRLGAEVTKASKSNPKIETITDEMRSRYVGGLDKNGYQPKLREEMKQNHRQLALECLNRAISFFEKNEIQSDQTAPLRRSGARLYYLTAGTLVGLEQYNEAMPLLEKAYSLTKGWRELHSKVRCLMVRVFQKVVPEVQAEKKDAFVGMLLDSCFNSQMSESNLHSILERLSSFQNKENIHWMCQCFDEADENLPISVAITFPNRTHGSAGCDTEAMLAMQSNIEHDIVVSSASISSLGFKIPLSFSVNPGARGEGLFLKAKAKLCISTSINLPEGAAEAEGEDSTNITKTPRPRTSGITSAAGACFNQPENEAWNQKFFGGHAFRCNELFITFHSAGESETIRRKIELKVDRVKSEPPLNSKRTPVEEEMYISSTWDRPKPLALSLGPRCLRVLPPQADMSLNNLTHAYTAGKVLEGTVNRVLFRLQAGPQENCKNISVRVICSNNLLSCDGERTRITSDPGDDDELGAVVDPSNASVRTPVLVRGTSNEEIQKTPLGYELPKGWAVAHDDFFPLTSSLGPGNTAYTFIDIYRPSPDLDGVSLEASAEDGNERYSKLSCQTDLELTVRYEKERIIYDEGDDPRSIDHKLSDIVHLTQNESLTWSTPMVASFSPGTKYTHPSGNRHPTNSTKIPIEPGEELVLIDGERGVAKCILESAVSAGHLSVNVEDVKFNDVMDENSPCSFTLRSGKDNSGILYRTRADDPCRKLIPGTKFSFAWTTEVSVRSNYLKGGVSARLGKLTVGWSPCPIPIPEGAYFEDQSVNGHGPLSLNNPCIFHLKGPPCYVENAPFDCFMEKLPDHIVVADPFEIVFHIKNKTGMDQKLEIFVDEAEGDRMHPIMFAGLVKGSVAVGPYESHTLTYTGVATKPGICTLPPISVSSHRYSTWLIRDTPTNAQSIFVAPR